MQSESFKRGILKAQNAIAKMENKNGTWDVIVAYDCRLGSKGTIVSKHKTYEAARLAARRSGYDDHLRISDPSE